MRKPAVLVVPPEAFPGKKKEREGKKVATTHSEILAEPKAAKPAESKEEDVSLTRQAIIRHLGGTWVKQGRQPQMLQDTITNITTTAMSDLKEVVYNVSTPAHRKVRSLLRLPLVELTLGVLTLVNSAMVAIDTLPNLPRLTRRLVDAEQDFIAYVFGAEFFARWFSKKKEEPTLRYLTRPLVLVDVVVVILPLLLSWLGPNASIRAFLPRWLTSSEGLQNLRLLRILRLQRVLKDKETFSRFSRALGLPDYNVRRYQLQLARVVLSFFTLLSVTSGLIYAAENAVNPNISSYFSALYFGVCTLSTVGFGEVYPMSNMGRLVVCMSIIAGVLVIPKQAADLLDALLRQSRRKEVREREIAMRSNKQQKVSTELCTSCGAVFHSTSARFCWWCGCELDNEAAYT